MRPMLPRPGTSFPSYRVWAMRIVFETGKPKRRAARRHSRRRGCPAAVRCLVDEGRADRPVLLGLELADLVLAVDDDPQSDRLHAAGGEAAAHLVPEERAQLVADEAVEDPARLLGIDLLGIDRARMIEGLADGALRDFVE